MVKFPEELKLEPEAKVMVPFTMLISPVPVILLASAVVRFIPNPELNPIPKEPPSETLMVVDPVPLSRSPERVKSLAVTVNALLVVDKVPEERVKSPTPLLSRSASIATTPLAVKLFASEIPELAVMVTAPTDVNALLTVILPFEESVSAPLLAVIEVPPKVMFPPEEVMFIPLASESALPPCRLMLPAPVNVLLLKVRPVLAVTVTAPVETSALLTLIVEPEEVRVRFPDEVVLLAERVKAPAVLKVIPLAKVKVEEFALMFNKPEELDMPLFKVIPLVAENEISPAPVMAPVMVILEPEDRVKAPALVMPPLLALKEILPAVLDKVMPLANKILSFPDRVSTALSESPSKERAPVVVVRLAFTSTPSTALAVKAENEEADPSKIIAPFEPDRCASTFNSTPFVKVDVV